MSEYRSVKYELGCFRSSINIVTKKIQPRHASLSAHIQYDKLSLPVLSRLPHTGAELDALRQESLDHE